MYVNWKALFSLGLAFWGLLCCTDLLGDSTWRRCSSHLDDILKGQYNELTRMQQHANKLDSPEAQKQRMNWPVLLWNICAFLCSLVFCSVIRSMSWVVWKIFKIYNVFRNRKVFSTKVTSGKICEEHNTPASAILSENKPNCKVLFKNQLFSPAKLDNAKLQEQVTLSKELEQIRKEKSELAQQLVMAQKENISASQQIEEYKLEVFMMKERLAKTSNTLKENLKYKTFANATQEMIARKAHSLEIHLKEVCRERDILRSKLSSLEKNYNKLHDRLNMFEKEENVTNLEQFPEKDTSHNPSPENEVMESETTDIDICKFQRKIMALQKNINNFESQKKPFDTNSKISMDLDESSFDIDTAKENDSETFQERENDKKMDVDSLKKNILNYNAYKAQMLRPKIRLANIKERLLCPSDTTGSSSDENNSSPHRIISSTVEFQNFLKTLNSNNGSSVNFRQTFF